MQQNIEPRKVAGVVAECNRVISDKDFSVGEVLIGLSELLGRVIVEAGGTPVSMEEIKKVCVQHMDKTISIGSQARGKSRSESGLILPR